METEHMKGAVALRTRPADARDIGGVLALQEKNLVTNLTEAAKADGFVTTPFTPEQLLSLIGLGGLFIVEAGGAVAGYAAAAGWDYFAGRPMFEHMIGRFSKLAFHGIPITAANSFQYGPVCIEHGLRGTGCFPLLFETMRRSMARSYRVGTTFINTVNERSYRAHTGKVGLEVIDRFPFNGSSYYGLAFLTG